MILEWRRAKARLQIVIFAAIVLASMQALADMRIRAMRNDSIIPISSLAPADPLRRRFGLLHGVSSLLMVAQVVLAGAAVVLVDDPLQRAPLRES